MLTCALLLLLAAGCASRQETEDFTLPGETSLRVEDFTIQGAEAFSEAELKAGLQTREDPGWRASPGVRWVPVLGGEHQYFNYIEWRRDLERIQTFYRARGYFDAKIVSEKIQENQERGTVRVGLRISEGSPTKITAISIEGLEATPLIEDDVIEDLPIALGTVFRQEDYRAAKEQLLRRLRGASYAYAEVRGRAVITPEKLEARIRLFVDPGPPSEFGEIEIVGLNVIDEEYVREAVTFEPGDPYTPEALERTQEEIYDLGVFSVVKVAPREEEADPDPNDVELSIGGDEPPGEIEAPREGPLGLQGVLAEAQSEAEQRARLDPIVPIRIRVNEARLWNVRVGAGVAAEKNRQDVHGRLDWSSRNFLGGLRKLEHFNSAGYAWAPGVFADPELRNSGIIVDSELRFTQPQFIESYTSLESSIRFRRTVEVGYTLTNPLARVGLRRRFFRRLYASASYNVGLNLYRDVVPSLLDPVQRLDFEYILEYFEQSLLFDYRNDFLNPTRGFAVDLRVQEASRYLFQLVPPLFTGGHFDYIKPILEVEGYVPYTLGLFQVLAMRAQVATIYNIGRPRPPPLEQRLYAGGAGSFRSFGRRELAPYSFEGEPIPIGGLTKFEAGVEPRIRLDRDFLDVGPLWIAPFLDAATVLPSSLILETRPARGTDPDAYVPPTNVSDITSTLLYGVGLGAWLITPIGPVRADFAYTLSDITSDERFRRCAVERRPSGECPNDNFRPVEEDEIQQRLSRFNFIINIGHSF